MAVGQGGSTGRTHAQQTTNNIFERLEQMGNETVTSDTFLHNSLTSINATLKTLTNEVNDLKRKQNRDHSPATIKRRKLTSASSGNDSSDSDNNDELDQFLEESREAPDREEWSELQDFFQNADETGDAIHEDLANVANKALRSKSKPEKTKLLQDKHKRPVNVENLQIPRVDEQVWKQLKKDTKSYDFAVQKCQQGMCLALIPTLKALELLKQPQPQIATVKDLVGDIFKCLAQTIVRSNENRMEKIKKDLLPIFKPLCDNTPSATNLFGDKLNENIKQLKENRTSLTSNREPFLGKRGGGSYNRNRTFNKYQYSTTMAYPPRTNQNYTGRQRGKGIQKNMKK